MTFSTFSKKLRLSATPLLGVLIDPDKFNPELIRLARTAKVSCFLVGGSRLEKGDVNRTVSSIKAIAPRIPVLLFPGDETQLSKAADGLLLLSLLSGRNPDYLIGKHVQAAPVIKKMKLPVLPTAYLLIEGGRVSATQQITNTRAIDSADKKQVVHTALAAQQLGFGAVYLEAGSGARKGIPTALVRAVRRGVGIPVIVGGGIDSVAKARAVIRAGANMVVVGNALEKNVYLLRDLSAVFNTKLSSDH